MTQNTRSMEALPRRTVSEDIIRGLRDAHLVLLEGIRDRDTRIAVAAQASILSVLIGEASLDAVRVADQIM
jgi:hypothetical protein